MSTKSSVVDTILGNTSRQQYKQVITHPPLSGPGSGVVPSNLPGVIEGGAPGPYLPDGGVCLNPTPDSWDFQWITISYTGVNPQEMVADHFVQLARPVKKLFMVGNNSPGGQAVFIHFNKLNKYAGTAASIATVDGNEQWIPFPGQDGLRAFPSLAGGSALVDTSYIKFCKPISKFYVTIINGSGAGTPLWTVTLLATDDVDVEYSNAT